MLDSSGGAAPHEQRTDRLRSWLLEESVDSGQTVSEAARSVLRHQFAVAMSKASGTRAGADPEDLHDMRVAIRRMRSAIAMFQPHLAEPVQQLGKPLKWLGGVLGPVRDLDVQIEQTSAWREEVDDDDAPAIEAVERHLRHRRTLARHLMLQQMGSSDYRGAVDGTIAALGDPAPEAPRILAVAPDVIERRRGRVRKLGDEIDLASPPERYHRLRVRAKALRYAIEFHRSLYGKRAERMIEAMKTLQDLLGDHQDADVARRHLRELREVGLPANTNFVLGILDERYRRRAIELRRAFPKAYESVDGKPWRRLFERMEARRPAAAESSIDPR
ncbi:MAG: CHAD domain-containing protein [Planctomycetes bacterium]|nr:CHAD domain-containing protein [Planctomycetota bacterium]